MKSTLFSLASVITLATVAVAQLPSCNGGQLKCCEQVTPYSALTPEEQDQYGVDPKTDANVCTDGTPVDSDFDAEICDSVEHQIQCCQAFVQTGPLPGPLTFNCHNV